MILGNILKNGLKQGIDMKLLAGDLPTGVASTFISPDGNVLLELIWELLLL